jgi:hypothetical protein
MRTDSKMKFQTARCNWMGNIRHKVLRIKENHSGKNSQ